MPELFDQQKSPVQPVLVLSVKALLGVLGFLQGLLQVWLGTSEGRHLEQPKASVWVPPSTSVGQVRLATCFSLICSVTNLARVAASFATPFS